MKNHFKDLKPNEACSAVMYRDEHNNQLTQYDSLSDVVRDVRTNKANGTWDMSCVDRENDDWRFGDTYPSLAETDKAFDNGYIKDGLLSKVDSTKLDILRQYPELANLQKSAHTLKRKRKYAESGNELDIDRYMSGEVEQWETKIMTKNKNSVRFFFDNCISGGEDSETILNNMIKLAAIMEIFTGAGMSVELLCGYAVHYNNFGCETTKYTVTTYKIKAANQPIDIINILNAGMPGLFRYYGFAVLQNMIPKMTDIGAGRPLQFGEHSGQLGIKSILDFAGIDLYIGGNNLNSGFTALINSVKVKLGIV